MPPKDNLFALCHWMGFVVVFKVLLSPLTRFSCDLINWMLARYVETSDCMGYSLAVESYIADQEIH
jgi:hypothetical protein